jgi:hypothetical protein
MNAFQGESDMDARLDELERLLAELTDLGAEAEERGIIAAPPVEGLAQRARDLGVAVPPGAGLEELRMAVEAACAGNGGGANHAVAREILGNERGVPGEGP